MAVDVHLDGRVERTDAETGNDFRTVGDFRRTDQEASAIVIDVLIEVFQVLAADGQRSRRSTHHAAFLDEAQGLFLQHFRIDIEVGHLTALSQRTKHGVRATADAALQDEFLGVDVAALHVVDQEIGHVLTDAVGGLG